MKTNLEAVARNKAIVRSYYEEGRLECAKCGDDQHAIQIKWRKVSNG
jgi:hypothetical protein